MKWRSWWNLRWYANDGREIDGMRPQFIRNVNHKEKPYERSPFGPSGECRFSSPGQCTAYFGVNLETATCETVCQFRKNEELTAEEVWEYLAGKMPSGESSKGYPIDHKLDNLANLADLRRNDNKLFQYIVEEGNWIDCDDFSQTQVYSRDKAVYPETQTISQAVLAAGFDGIWYRSVRAPSGFLVDPAECLVLFEGRENLLRIFGSNS
jgi:hypothetical protein